MDTAVTLRHSLPFLRAPQEAIDRLAASTTVRRLEHDEKLWHAGDESSSFSVIYSGLIKIVRSLPNGRDAILGLFGPRESVGDVAVLQGIPFPASAVVASEGAVVLRIPRAVVIDAMNQWPGLAVSVTRSMGERVHSLQSKVQILSAGTVEARLGSLLLDMAERFGDEFEDGTVRIPVALSRQDLANLVSTSFETAIRVMSRWSKAGVVETQPDGFVLKKVDVLRQASRTVGGGKSGDPG